MRTTNWLCENDTRDKNTSQWTRNMFNAITAFNAFWIDTLMLTGICNLTCILLKLFFFSLFFLQFHFKFVLDLHWYNHNLAIKHISEAFIKKTQFFYKKKNKSLDIFASNQLIKLWSLKKVSKTFHNKILAIIIKADITCFKSC